MSLWSELRSDKVRCLKTIGLLSCYLSLGLTMEIVGPTLMDLQQQVQTSFTKVSFAITSRSIGYALGSLIIGLTGTRVNFLLATSIVFVASAIFTFSVAFTKQLWSLLLVFALNGTCLGFFEAGCNVFILHLWGRQTGPFLQGLQFMYGCGAILSPLIVEPFLVIKNVHSVSTVSSSHLSYIHILDGNVTNSVDPEEVQLIFPYSIIACILAFNSILMSTIWMLHPETEEHPSRSGNKSYKVLHEDDMEGKGSKSEEGMEDSRSKQNHDDDCNIWKVALTFLVMLFMNNYQGLEVSLGSYVMSFAADSSMKLSKATGANLTALFWSTFTFTKVGTIFCLQHIGNEVMILISLAALLIANTILLVYGNESEIMLCIGIALIGCGMASIFGCIFGYVEEFSRITSLIGSLMMFSAVLGEFAYPIAISYFIQDYPLILMWLSLWSNCCMICTFALIVLLAHVKLGAKTHAN